MSKHSLWTPVMFGVIAFNWQHLERSMRLPTCKFFEYLQWEWMKMRGHRCPGVLPTCHFPPPGPAGAEAPRSPCAITPLAHVPPVLGALSPGKRPHPGNYQGLSKHRKQNNKNSVIYVFSSFTVKSHFSYFQILCSYNTTHAVLFCWASPQWVK